MNHKFVEKPWGSETWIVNNEKYCGKLLKFNQGKKCSWHYHKIKDEVMYLQSGKLRVTTGYNPDIKHESNKTFTLSPGESFHVPTGLIHQMEALEDSELFEFSTQHFDEDSIRISVN